MSIIIIGGDRLGKIPLLLKEHGFHLLEHVPGRKKGDIKTGIPREAEGVVIFTDFLNHNLALEIKAAAKRQGKKVVFAQRSWSKLSKALLDLKA